METDNITEFHYSHVTPALVAKERQLLDTLRALEGMLDTVQELRTKVNFERTQLINLIEMARSKARGESSASQQETQEEQSSDPNNESLRDPLVLLDKLYNGAFCVSEEEEEDDELEDDDDLLNRGDDFGTDSVQW